MLSKPRGDQRWATIGHLLADAASRHEDRPAVVYRDQRVSYAQLHAEARGVARGLIGAGVARGDRVAIWAPNGLRWLEAALGAQLAGAALVPINTRYRGSEAAYILGRAEPHALFVAGGFLGNDYLGMLEDAGYAFKRLPLVVDVGDGHGVRAVGWSDFTDVVASVSEEILEGRLAQLDGSDLSDIMFTSGTTGHPKGVMTTHAQNLRAYFDWSRLAGMREGERYAIINPFFHAFGYKVGWLASLMHGMTMYPHAVLNVPELLDQVEAEQITLLPGPPTLFSMILDEQQQTPRDLGSLRLAITGAASVPATLVKRMFSELGFERVTTCYGMTEGTGIATITRAEDDLQTVAETSGRALPDVEIQVVDDAGTAVGPGELGEVLLRGYNTMQGYLGAKQQTAARVDADGWLHTGDIGRMDERGNLSVTDRKGDMFVVGGFNAYPAEIEAVLLDHPAIAQAAVIGIPDQRLGEVGLAFVVIRRGLAPTADEITAWTRERLANFKVPRAIEFVTDLPRNATGKVLKGELRTIARTLPPPLATTQR
jgi:acyl-CoA synthetase (AMP-forming)/AMP-acid ligase II